METFSFIADLVGILAALFSLLAWINIRIIKNKQIQDEKRMMDSIKIVLCYGRDELELPIGINRKDLTRAEIMGRIGAIPMKYKQDRYKIEYLGTGKFIKDIEIAYADNSTRDFKIPCNKEEFSQFDLEAYQKIIK